MSLAAETRRRVAEHPFLVAALRAGVVNHTAAARFLDVEGETEAVATALRRYAAELPEYETTARDARVTMQRGVGPVDDPADAFLSVGGTALGPADGDATAILADGPVDAAALATVLETLALEGVAVAAAGVGSETMVVVVDRLEGANAVRAVEGALEDVPTSPS
ncbi:DUF7523 family protein [Natrialbaceae archaeon AArc-T1-2]|uniref:DUF7523 family protein n=1 Tax=Natrialbaceae archaeon AArc-T1-2 TaxID=3053904 RepID=UPI00255A9A4E|nr:hypothetical protein [Natrialbaceae archaeon AArc-T1-2]WIV66100.1 hypothetical protein QQ977_10380 [Natrialbaceae archaeon AArc-T1-2]